MLFSGCDDEKKPHEVAPATPTEIASALGIDAAALGGTLVDPEKPAGDLGADLASFTTVEACMKQRASTLDPLVGDAVDAIGYDTFLRDACRVLEAAKTKDAKKCELIDASALRARCRAITAMVAGNADGCPLKAPSKPELGRDAACVAAALRSPAMCAGASKRDEPACEALVTHDPKKCDAIPLDEVRTPCTREARRFQAVLGGEPAIASVPAPKGTLTLHGDGRPDPAKPTADLEGDIGSGVVVVVDGSAAGGTSRTPNDGKKTRVTFGHPTETFAASPHVAQPLERTRFALAFVQSPDKPLDVAAASLSVPGAIQSSCASPSCTLTVKVTKLEPKRGGAVEFTADGTLGGFRLHAEVTTFVRDVVTVGP